MLPFIIVGGIVYLGVVAYVVGLLRASARREEAHQAMVAHLVDVRAGVAVRPDKVEGWK